MVLQRTFFYCEIWNFKIFFLNNKTRKLDVAESNPIMENILSFLYLSLSLSVRFLFLLVHVLSLSVSLSLSLSFC